MWKERLDELLADENVLNRMLQYAAAQTILKEIRNRFVAGLPEALHVHSMSADPKPTRVGKDMQRSMTNALQSLSEAYAQGDKGLIDKAERRVRRLQSAYQNALQGSHGRNASKPSTFAKLVGEAMKVMTLMAGSEAVTSLAPGQIGIGNIAQLDKIKTPTANRKGTTRSRMTTLWRHLEFGTGIYALDKSVNAESPFKEPKSEGAWWWGRERGRGVLIAGSMPLDALNVNEADVDAFAQTFRVLLAQALAL